MGAKVGTADRYALASVQLREICERCRASEARYGAELLAVHPKYGPSARNLVHYLALRESGIEELQEDLTTLGLSSLDRIERNVLGSVQSVQSALRAIMGDSADSDCVDPKTLELRNAAAIENRRAIIGDAPSGRDVSIMVTLPREAGSDYSLVRTMLEAGASIARINCAHDDEGVWANMVHNVRKASAETGIECRIVMDLEGPKIRTGELRPGPKVYHIRPRRDPLGRTIAPRRVRFIPDDSAWHGTKSAVIPVPRECINLAHPGDTIKFRDTRGKKREFSVVEKDDKGLVLEIYKTAYLASNAKLKLIRKHENEKLIYRVGDLPAVEQAIRLKPGDTLHLDRDPLPGAPAVEDSDGRILEPAHIACRQPEVFDYVAPGDRVVLNDGKIAGVARSIDDARLDVEILKAKPTGSRLRGDRGINFPDSDIRLPGITDSDRENLDFVIRNADAVSQSFVRQAEDILELQGELAAMGGDELGIIIKIETRKAFKNLPRLLLTAMRSYPAAVMIARGDLAVEAGWERMAELQEEILWLCEAAHMPVIWATQVLENTAKRGRPSRAEISDAALAQRADCVMLNKGPHIVAAIRMLDDILRRMQGHQYKKTPKLRRLRFSAE